MDATYLKCSTPELIPPKLVAESKRLFMRAALYKELNAPLGSFALRDLQLSTESSLAGSTTYGRTLERRLRLLVRERTGQATDMRSAINGSAKSAIGQPVRYETLIRRATLMLHEIEKLEFRLLTNLEKRL